jgi:hypothetical protein
MDPDAYSSVPDEFDGRGQVDVELPSGDIAPEEPKLVADEDVATVGFALCRRTGPSVCVELCEDCEGDGRAVTADLAARDRLAARNDEGTPIHKAVSAALAETIADKAGIVAALLTTNTVAALSAAGWTLLPPGGETEEESADAQS